MRDQLWINQVARCPKELNKVKRSKPAKRQHDRKLQQQQISQDHPMHKTTPRKKLNNNSKDIKRHTSADKILQTFQSRNLTTDQWNKLADQELTRGVQKYAEDILKSTDMGGEENQKRSTRILR